MPKPQTPSLFELDPPEETTPCSHILRVAFESGADQVFSYLCPDEIWPVQAGQRVEAPFGRGNKQQTGFCVQTQALLPPSQDPEAAVLPFKLKAISAVVDTAPLLDATLLELAEWISNYYVCPLGQVLAAMVPGAVKRSAGVKKKTYLHLAPGVDLAKLKIRGTLQKQILAALEKEGAHDSESAIALAPLAERLNCTSQPAKALAKKGIVQFTTRHELPALPALPGELLVPEEQDLIINEDQQNALNHILQEIKQRRFGVSLLHGVTGSGKTEVYIRAIQAALEQNLGAIVLLPEIALTAQTLQRFKIRFGSVAVLHSGLSATQRHAQWQSIRSGETQVVVGARSAIFAPLATLGLIVVDEEHESSYKQDSLPRYHGRDLAIKRAQLAQAHCILGSATPSLETLLNCQTREAFTCLVLPKRVKDLPMPHMRLVDIREEPTTKSGFDLLSGILTKKLATVLSRQEQAILLLNRRGYSSFIFCPTCKHSLQCKNCDVTLTFHKRKGREAPTVNTVSGRHLGFGHAICHYCQAQALVPSHCPLCAGKMIMMGLGSQRLEEELATKLPQARVARIDSDSMAHRDYYQILKQFGEGRVDILAGTQMIAKGLHFPNVTLVGIISADTALFLPDFRASERTYQLIAQVAGRAGRAEKKGEVIVQTVMPDQPAIQLAKAGNFDGFARQELALRKRCKLPPYSRMATIVLRDQQFERLEKAAEQLRQRIDHLLASLGLQAQVRGPHPPLISRIQRFHRLQIVIQAERPSILQTLFQSLRAQPPLRPTVRTTIDVDPVNLF